MDIKSQNLGKNRENIRMERALDIEKLERLKLEEELQRSRMKCEKLEENVARLLEEKNISKDREKRSDDRCEKISAENSRISDEYQALVLALSEKVGELQCSKLEHERIAGICKEEFKCFDAMMLKFEGVIRCLKREKSAAAKALEELKLENIELRREKLEAQHYISIIENVSSKISQVEEDLAGVLGINVGDLGRLSSEVRELPTTESSADSEGGDDGDSSGNPKGSADSKVEDDDSTRNAENDVVSPREAASPVSARISNTGLSDKDDKVVVQPCEIREDADAPTFEDSPEREGNECEVPLESGAQLGRKHLHSPSTKSARSSPATAITTVIDIIDSDDEITNPNGVTQLVPTPQTSKRNRTDNEEGLLTTKRQRDECTKDSSVQKLSAVSDEESEDEYLSESVRIHVADHPRG